MQKVLLLTVATLLVATSKVHGYEIIFGDATNSVPVGLDNGFRQCLCISNTDTTYIEGVNGGLIRLFSSSDCTGNYETLGSNSEITNAQWVNSISYGASGIASLPPQGSCKWY